MGAKSLIVGCKVVLFGHEKGKNYVNLSVPFGELWIKMVK